MAKRKSTTEAGSPETVATATTPDAPPSSAEYTVLARRYRPQQFEDLVGQEAISQVLVNALESQRVAHAYLFTGARGVGKTSTGPHPGQVSQLRKRADHSSVRSVRQSARPSRSARTSTSSKSTGPAIAASMRSASCAAIFSTAPVVAATRSTSSMKCTCSPRRPSTLF